MNQGRIRNALEGAVAYAVAGWILIQLANVLEESLDLPAWVDRWATLGIIGGFPVVVIGIWAFNISLGSFRPQPLDRSEPVAPLVTAPATKAVDRRSIAVLPFVDMSAEGNQEYFGDGIAEEILNALVKVEALKVAGRTSSFQYKGRNENLSRIGEALNVAHVLEGSVRKQGDRVRITAQLIQSSDGYHLWSETFDGVLTDIFDLQDEISRAVAAELEVLLDAGSPERLATNLTNSPEAYEYFLQGRQLVHRQLGQQTLPRAVELLEKAVALDPDFAEAWAWLADANYTLTENSVTRHWKDHIEAAHQAGQRALSLDPELPMAHHARAYAASHARKLDEAFEIYKRAWELDPDNAELTYAYGYALAGVGQLEAARELMAVLEEHPLIAAFHTNYGNLHFALEDYDAAARAYQRSFDFGYTMAALPYAYMLSSLGRREEAFEVFDRAYDRLPPLLARCLVLPYSRSIVTAAVIRRWRAAQWTGISIFRLLSSLPNAQPAIHYPTGLFLAGAPGAMLANLREKPSPYALGILLLLQFPTDEGHRTRTHKDFPATAEALGLVRIWQKHGWPAWAKPLPGTDGSERQFVCS